MVLGLATGLLVAPPLFVFMGLLGVKEEEAWQFFPAHAILTMAGRIDASGTTEFLSSFLTVPTREAVRDLWTGTPGPFWGATCFKTC
jgi:hypothetical protein